MTLTKIQRILLSCFIFFGAIVHATAQLKISRENKTEFSAVDFFILVIIASFSGAIFGLLASAVFQSLVWITLFSGMGAFLGIAWLNKLGNIMLDKLAGLFTDFIRYFISKYKDK